MAAIGGSGSKGPMATGAQDPCFPEEHVADLMKSLNLTAEESEFVEFSDDDDDGDAPVVEWAVVGR